MKSKKEIINKFIERLTRKLSRKKNVIFYSPTEFQSRHLTNIINNIFEDKSVNIILCGKFIPSELSHKITIYKDFPFWRRIDLLISTELSGIPYWLTSKKIFFGHGAGPKLNYQSSKNLAKFDSSFSPCTPIYNAHKKIINKVFKIGLPILETDFKDEENNIRKKIKLSTGKPIVLYAPSWSSDIDRFQKISEIIDYLIKQDKYLLVVSPHPNLLLPIKNKGLTFPKNKNYFLNLSDSGVTTLEIASISEIVISDISSILYESLAIGVNTIWDGDVDLYLKSGAEKIAYEIKEKLTTLNMTARLEDHFFNKKLQKDFIESYMFNIGHSVKEFHSTLINELRDI